MHDNDSRDVSTLTDGIIHPSAMFMSLRLGHNMYILIDTAHFNTSVICKSETTTRTSSLRSIFGFVIRHGLGRSQLYP